MVNKNVGYTPPFVRIDDDTPINVNITATTPAFKQLFNIPGLTDAVNSSVYGDLSQIPGVTVLPTPGGIQLRLKSTDIGDTILGAGIREIQVEYLDSNGDFQTEAVEMDGQTEVDTVATDIVQDRKSVV